MAVQQALSLVLRRQLERKPRVRKARVLACFRAMKYATVAAFRQALDDRLKTEATRPAGIARLRSASPSSSSFADSWPSRPTAGSERSPRTRLPLPRDSRPTRDMDVVQTTRRSHRGLRAASWLDDFFIRRTAHRRPRRRRRLPVIPSTSRPTLPARLRSVVVDVGFADRSPRART